MALAKAKRSIHKKQSAVSTQNPGVRLPHSKLVRFPPAKNKIVESVEFSASLDHHHISINFQDKTCLNFSIETGFTLETDYSDWKSGEQRILRAWPLIRSQQ